MNLSNSPTLSVAATQQGVILGTAAYMSPEQARGKTVDKRADIWAFGVVLYEMLTGRSLFAGEDVSSTLARVLEREPDFSILPAKLHSRIRFLLERCLKKEPKNRHHDIADARVDIQEVLADPGGVFAQPVSAVELQTKSRSIMPWIVAIIGIAIVGAVVWYLRAPEPPQVMRFDYELPENQRFTNAQVPVMSVSPDGKQFVYATFTGLYLRSVDEFTAKLIDGTRGLPVQPYFSPDGKWIAYLSFMDQKLKKIPINGGTPLVICDITSFVGGYWNEDDTIVFGQLPGPIMQVSANGGTPEAITEATDENHVFPQILPGGEYLMYTAVPNNRVIVQSLKSGETKELFQGIGATYLPTGHIIYTDNDNLYAIPFDLDSLQVTGGAVPIVEGILQYGVSSTGTLVFIPGTSTVSSSGERTLVWVDRDGKEEPLGTPPNSYRHPKISPDATRVALAVLTGDNANISVWDIVRKRLSPLTFDKENDANPIWTPDGKKIIYASWRGGEPLGGVYWKAADGTGEIEKIASFPERALLPYSISSDGKYLANGETIDLLSQWDIGILSLEGELTRKALLNDEEYIEVQPQISPDGCWIAFASNETGQQEVFIRPFLEVEKGQWQASTSGGHSPLWSPKGRELFYLSNDGSAMAVPVETEPTFSLGAPKMLFRHSNVRAGRSEGIPWDIHPDGKRFLMMKPAGAEGSVEAGIMPRKINIILNWFEELKDRVPGD
jgi:serine/threonine-protein kinase